MNDEIKTLADELGHDPETVQQMVDGTLRVLARWVRGGLAIDEISEPVIAAALHLYAENYRHQCHKAYLHRTQFARLVLNLIAAKTPA